MITVTEEWADGPVNTEAGCTERTRCRTTIRTRWRTSRRPSSCSTLGTPTDPYSEALHQDFPPIPTCPPIPWPRCPRRPPPARRWPPCSTPVVHTPQWTSNHCRCMTPSHCPGCCFPYLSCCCCCQSPPCTSWTSMDRSDGRILPGLNWNMICLSHYHDLSLSLSLCAASSNSQCRRLWVLSTCGKIKVLSLSLYSVPRQIIPCLFPTLNVMDVWFLNQESCLTDVES